MTSAMTTIRTRRAFLPSLTQSERDTLMELGINRWFPSGSVLMFEYEPSERIMILLQGRIKVTRALENGRELLLAICDPGEILGELGFIDDEPRTATVTALDRVEALVMPTRAFRGLLDRSPRLTELLLESATRRCRETLRKYSRSAALDTMGRLAACIIELAERYGEPTSDGLGIEMPISQEELASWTGASRAGVAQALQTMRGLDWIITKRRRIVVRDPAALRSRAH